MELKTKIRRTGNFIRQKLLAVVVGLQWRRILDPLFYFFILFSVLISAVVTVLLRKKKYTHIEKEEKTKKNNEKRKVHDSAPHGNTPLRPAASFFLIYFQLLLVTVGLLRNDGACLS